MTVCKLLLEFTRETKQNSHRRCKRVRPVADEVNSPNSLGQSARCNKRHVKYI